MAETASNESAAQSPFPRTRWTLVLQASSPHEGTARQALEELCQSYWYPIYSFLRRAGHKPEDAEDLTQGFFAELLTGQVLSVASSDRGRLRTFLLATLKRFLAREYRHAHAQKRGGQAVNISWDQDQAEVRFSGEMIQNDSPDLLFERSWAANVVARAQAELDRQYDAQGKETLFQALREFLSWDKGNAAYREAARRLGMTETNFRTNVYRLRKRFRRILEREIADTVETPEQARQELDHLLEILAGR